MSTPYAEFIGKKEQRLPETGIAATTGQLHPLLHDWQREIVTWACRVGRAAVWADTGLGKTIMQLSWLNVMRRDGIGVVVAPLAVCRQTVQEARKIGITAEYVREMPTKPGVYVTNYEMVHHLHPDAIAAVVLDEASILKQSDGKTRTMLIGHFRDVPYRLACTATPAPNDPEELTNQSEFLGHMSRANMLAAYFVHDDKGWRLKGHAKQPMYTWMSTWAVALRRPSDLGYTDDGYNLPGLRIHPHLVDSNVESEGQLFATDLGGVTGRSAVRRQTLKARCERAAELVAAEPNEPWLLWCGLNDEANLIAELTGATNIHGTLTPEQKADLLMGFADGTIQRIVTKPSLAAFGLNWQHCARMAFVGLSDSYEAYYQAIRRCYRYGQTRIVDAHIILSDLESQISTNVARKERESADMTTGLIEAMRRARLGKAS